MNKTTALIFTGIIVIGVGVSLYTLNKRDKTGAAWKLSGPSTKQIIGPDQPVPSTNPPPPPATTPAKNPATNPATPPAAPAKVDPAAGENSGTSLYESPEAMMKALAQKIGAKDFAGFLGIVGSESIADPIKDQVKSLVESSELKLDPAKPFTEISKSAESLRWALNFIPEAGERAVRQLYADLTEMENDVLDITGISFPLNLPSQRGSDTPQVDATSGESSVLKADALTVAHAFSKAVIQRDFNSARLLSDPSTVTDERVAALMIAVEEGKFILKEDRPLVVTLARDDITWVLTRVQSDKSASEFALELGQVGNVWKVNGLTFSKVLLALSELGGAGNVAYSPIVDDPSGGDSLVLYFEFDEAGLTTRASRQLAIIADILSQGKDRVIRINGHADALGSDNYNVELSDQRAESIRKSLISMGVKPDQVITEGFGAAKPRKPNFLPDGSDNPGGRSQNRRAEVLLDF